MEIEEEDIKPENIKEYMDEPNGYYLYVKLKSDNKYHLLHIYNNEVNFILTYGFSITEPDSNFLTKIENENILNILKTYCDYNDINLSAPIFKESDNNIKIRIRFRTLKRKLENPSFPPKNATNAKRMVSEEASEEASEKASEKASEEVKKIKLRSKF